jgi:hypothetical protein
VVKSVQAGGLLGPGPTLTTTSDRTPMFDFFAPNHPFGGQTLRLVAQSQQGGGDVFDIARTCSKIEVGHFVQRFSAAHATPP